MSPARRRSSWSGVRVSPRINSVTDISVDYEGHSEHVVVRPPDISTHGMFINTSRKFPEGSILNLRFRLVMSGIQIASRCEVRYCLPGVGVGVEFVCLPAKALRAIEREISLNTRSKSARRRSRRR